MSRRILQLSVIASVLLLFWILYKCPHLHSLFLTMEIKTGWVTTSELINALDDRSETTRGVVVSALVRRGSQTIPLLIQALDDNNEARREGAAITFRFMATQSRVNSLQDKNLVLKALYKSLTDDSPRVRVQAARAVLSIDQKPAMVIPILVALWNDEDLHVRYEAADALCEIGPAAREAIPALKMGLKDDDSRVRLWASNALKAIGDR